MRDEDYPARLDDQVDREGHFPPDVASRTPISLPVLDDAAKGLEPPPKKPITKKPIFWIGLIVLAALLVAGFFYWQNARQFESTDDAFVDAHIVRVAPKQAGVLQAVYAVDNAHVNPGDLLAVIEPSDARAQYEQALASVANAQGQLAQYEAQAEQQRANIAAARATTRQQLANVGVPAADAERARRDLARYESLQHEQPDAVAQTTIDQVRAQAQSADAQTIAARAGASNAGANITVARRQLRAAEANVTAGRASVREAEARVAAAQVTLRDLRLVASVRGHVANRTVNVGSYVSPGTQIMAIVPDTIWVTANFKETQLADMRIGQHVDIVVDALPHTKFEGHIDSFQRGAGQAFALLPAENATGNFVKVVQRVPVRIVFDRPSPLNYPIGPGMSVSPRVKVR